MEWAGLATRAPRTHRRANPPHQIGTPALSDEQSATAFVNIERSSSKILAFSQRG